VLVTKTRQRLADLDYDFDDLAKVMHQYGLVTAVVWLETKNRYHALAWEWSRIRLLALLQRLLGAIFASSP
jgi:hypothetical protein